MGQLLGLPDLRDGSRTVNGRDRWNTARTRRFAVSLVLCATAWAAGWVVQAHEIGTTRVRVRFEHKRYEIEIASDAVTLMERLHAGAGAPLPDAKARPTATVIAAHDALYRSRVAVMFDGRVAETTAHYAIEGASDEPPGVVVRLSGAIPAGAREFTWRYQWTFASYALTIDDDRTGASHTQWLEGDQSSTPFSLAQATAGESRATMLWRYLVLGATHIVPYGLDHVLFVLGLFLLSSRMRPLLWQVSAFTLAHSITLALSMLDVLDVSPAVVEPLIAVSIAYVAVENLFHTDLRSWRVAIVFVFGLLHGLGFAGVLRDVGLDRADLSVALLGFNMGVEAGQLAVVATASVLLGSIGRHRPWYRQRIAIPASLVIACVAIYWTVERLA
jgi:hypothetical protein